MSRLRLDDPVDPERRIVAALLWESGCSTARLANLATMLSVGYRAHNKLRHKGGEPGEQLKVQRLLTQTFTDLMDRSV